MRMLMVGSSAYADIVLSDPTIDPRHLEIVVTDGDRVYCIDCGTAEGTWIRPDGAEGGDWIALRQGFVDRAWPVKLGAHVCALGELLARADGPGGSLAAADRIGADRGRSSARPGRVARDPVTGEVVLRR